MSRAWAGGSTRAHRQLRAIVALRDGGMCKLQTSDQCQTYGNQLHHKLGKGVSDDPDDCCWSCGPCNREVGDPRKTDPAPEPRTKW